MSLSHLTILIFLFGFAALNDNEIQKDFYTLHQECVQGIHKQINNEMHASLVYAAMAAHFNNNNVARPGTASFFLKNSKEEEEHARKFIDYMNRRGAKLSNFKIKMPAVYSWNGTLEALRDAILLEKLVNNKLHHLHKTAADSCEDQHLMDFIEKQFLDEQVESIDQLQRYITILDAMNNPMGEYLFDLQLNDKSI